MRILELIYFKYLSKIDLHRMRIEENRSRIARFHKVQSNASRDSLVLRTIQSELFRLFSKLLS